MGEGKKFCPAMWFSGFFALGFLVHALRLILGVPVSIGSQAIPMSVSVVVVIVAGALSLGLLVLSMKRPCDSEKTPCGAGSK